MMCESVKRRFWRKWPKKKITELILVILNSFFYYIRCKPMFKKKKKKLVKRSILCRQVIYILYAVDIILISIVHVVINY